MVLFVLSDPSALIVLLLAGSTVASSVPFSREASLLRGKSCRIFAWSSEKLKALTMGLGPKKKKKKKRQKRFRLREHGQSKVWPSVQHLFKKHTSETAV